MTGYVILDLENTVLAKAASDVEDSAGNVINWSNKTGDFVNMASSQAQWQEAIEFLLTRWHNNFRAMFPNAKGIIWYDVPPQLTFIDAANGLIDRANDGEYDYLMKRQRVLAMKHYQFRKIDEDIPPDPGGASSANILKADKAGIDRGLKFAGIHGIPLMVFTWDEYLGAPLTGLAVDADVLALMRDALASRPYIEWFGVLGNIDDSQTTTIKNWLTEKWLKEFG